MKKVKNSAEIPTISFSKIFQISFWIDSFANVASIFDYQILI